jgi:transposase
MATSAKDIQIRELKDMILQLKSVISSLEETIKESNKREAALHEQIDYLTKKLFGKSSEKNRSIPGQLSLFDALDEETDLSAIEVEAETLTDVVVKEHKRKPKRSLEERIEGLPVEEILIPLSDDKKTCPDCGTEMVFVGKEYDHQELEYIPAKVKLIKYYTETYVCPKCKEEAETPVFVKSSSPMPLIQHSYASPSSVAWSMYQKYVMSVPAYRQEQDWKQHGVDLSRDTLLRWMIYCTMEYFTPLYNCLHRKLLERKFLMADETRIQVLNEPERKAETQSFMWLFRSGEDGLPPIILYNYTETRAKANALSFLKGFSGYLETDGYQGYNNLPNVKRCCCWAHVRRYFVDAIPKGKELDIEEPAVQGTQFCDKLFDYERRSRERGDSPTQRYKYRLQKEKPLLEAFWRWIEKQHPDKGTRLYKAIVYVQNCRPYLETYLEDGHCSFSNNLSENAIRPFTVGRKNWLFSNSQDGATTSAVIYSLVEMAKVHELNVYKYLTFLLEKRPSKEWADEQLDDLMPWSETVRSVCMN